MPDFFGGLTNRSLEKLETVQKRRTVAAGSILFLEDEEGRFLYRLISGSIRLFRSTPDGREVTIHLVEPGDLFAEIVLFERDTYPASAVAVEDSLVSVIDRAQIHELLGDARFRDDFLKNLVGKMRFLSQQLYVLTTMDVEERLARFLETRLGRFETVRFSLSKKATAAAISVRPETLSRVLSRLDEAGLLRWKRGTIEASPEFWKRRE